MKIKTLLTIIAITVSANANARLPTPCDELVPDMVTMAKSYRDDNDKNSLYKFYVKFWSTYPKVNKRIYSITIPYLTDSWKYFTDEEVDDTIADLTLMCNELYGEIPATSTMKDATRKTATATGKDKENIMRSLRSFQHELEASKEEPRFLQWLNRSTLTEDSGMDYQ